MMLISLLLAASFSTPIIALFVIPSPHVTDLHPLQYALTDQYIHDNIFSDFSFFKSSDPQIGFVKYVDLATAESEKLVGSIPSVNDTMYIGVDHHNLASDGRNSVRLTSKKSWNHGLFVADIEHMPGGICGVWPSLKLRGEKFPDGGEIDIIEGVNIMSRNAMTLHTSGKCKNPGFNGFSGSVTSQGCGTKSPGTNPAVGCSILAPAAETSFGESFNSAGGGVFVTEWTSKSITIWFFPRGNVPDDLRLGPSPGPRPSTWVQPLASFKLDCNMDKHFQNLQLVIDTNFCGDWAGDHWANSPCSEKTKSCADFVGRNPKAFKGAYWQINHLRVYEHT